jgi:NAD(P)-dependent dehydrogenase (short-subunit alcohol dehydrogenase family)
MQSKHVIVTGANNGIGLGLTRALRDRGFHVAGLDLSTENLRDVSGVQALVCDITIPGQIERTVNSIADRWGRIDILVNNACLAVFASFEDKPVADTRREFEVNYFGTIRMIQAVLPIMRSQSSGVIHNVSSTVGTSGFAGLYGYASTKGAIEALTRTLALELRPHGIVVNLIHPPLTRTKSSSPLGVPANFMADPEDVGRKLATKIGSRQPVLTPDLTVSLGVWMTNLFPRLLGSFLSEKAAQARNEADLNQSARPDADRQR